MTSNKYYNEKNCSKQHENENYCPTYLFIFSKKRIYKTKKRIKIEEKSCINNVPWFEIICFSL